MEARIRLPFLPEEGRALVYAGVCEKFHRTLKCLVFYTLTKEIFSVLHSRTVSFLTELISGNNGQITPACQ